MLNAVSVGEIGLSIEAYVSEVKTRRFRYCLTSPGEPEQPSAESFATRREAQQAGEIARQRAVGRGRIGR